MNDERVLRFRPRIDRLEAREVPAFVSPIKSAGGGVRLAVGDFNHDGRADVAAFQGTIVSSQAQTTGGSLDLVALGGKTNVSVSLSKTDGTFQKPVKLWGAQGAYLYVLELRDWNGDGNLDVVARTNTPHGNGLGANQGPSYGERITSFTNIWLGRGDGSFASVTTTQVEYLGWLLWSVNSQAATGDFNRDGTLDGTTVDGTTSVVNVSLGNIDGTFQSPRSFAAGLRPVFVAVGDFNGDGWTDIVVVNDLSSNSPTLSVLLNDGKW